MKQEWLQCMSLHISPAEVSVQSSNLTHSVLLTVGLDYEIKVWVRKRHNIYLQKRFIFFIVIFLHLKQPAVSSLPEEGGSIRVFTTLSAHVEFNVLGTDSAAELCIRKLGLILDAQTSDE